MKRSVGEAAARARAPRAASAASRRTACLLDAYAMALTARRAQIWLPEV
jgi:hypothetical protein